MHAGRKAWWGGKQACMQRGICREAGRKEGRKEESHAAGRHRRQEGRHAIRARML